MEVNEQTQLWLERRFDELYDCIPDPWGCKAASSSFDNTLFFMLIEDYKRQYKSILDIGCGLGHLTQQLRFYLTTEHDLDVVGVDISKTAIDSAIKTYPGIQFFEWDIINDGIHAIMMEQFELVTMSEVMWYWCDHFDEVMKKVQALLTKDGIFAIHQYFPFEQNYYKEFVDGIYSFEYMMTKSGWNQLRKVVSYNEQGQVLLALYQVKKEADNV